MFLQDNDFAKISKKCINNDECKMYQDKHINMYQVRYSRTSYEIS